jgi:hypothetical protein
VGFSAGDERVRVIRNLGVVLLVVLLALAIGCGNEPPEPGNLAVTSAPEGAAISIDGLDTGEVTPHTFPGLEGGTSYLVGVSLGGLGTERTVLVSYGTTVEAAFTLGLGSLTVTSAPAGAAILLDGEDTGEVTPHTFDALLAGDYVVSVALDGFFADPAQQDVTIDAGAAASADFALALARVVLLEGFSNVYCTGCPTMNANVDYVLHQPGYDASRVLYVKWPALLSPLDPFYWVTQDVTNARVAWYFGSSQINLPSLAGDGGVLGGLGTPVGADGMTAFIDGQPATAAFRIVIETDEDLGDTADLSHDATVTIDAPEGADLTGCHLNVALVYEQVEAENEGYIEGVTEFHWVMRDHAQPSTDIGAVPAGSPVAFTVTLDDPLGGELPGHAVFPAGKQIIAWVQDAATKDVLQAGSTVTTITRTTASTTGHAKATHDSRNGGSR